MLHRLVFLRLYTNLFSYDTVVLQCRPVGRSLQNKVWFITCYTVFIICLLHGVFEVCYRIPVCKAVSTCCIASISYLRGALRSLWL